MAFWYKDKSQKLLDGIYPWADLNNYEKELSKKEQIIINIDNAMIAITDEFIAKRCPDDFDWSKWFNLSKKINNLKREREELIVNSINEYNFYLLLASCFRDSLDILPISQKQKFINLQR